MPSSKPLVNAKGEVREIRGVRFAVVPPAEEALSGVNPPQGRSSRPQKTPTKETHLSRLSRRSCGGSAQQVMAGKRGWTPRSKIVGTHKPARPRYRWGRTGQPSGPPTAARDAV